MGVWGKGWRSKWGKDGVFFKVRGASEQSFAKKPGGEKGKEEGSGG